MDGPDEIAVFAARVRAEAREWRDEQAALTREQEAWEGCLQLARSHGVGDRDLSLCLLLTLLHQEQLWRQKVAQFELTYDLAATPWTTTNRTRRDLAAQWLSAVRNAHLSSLACVEVYYTILEALDAGHDSASAAFASCFRIVRYGRVTVAGAAVVAADRREQDAWLANFTAALDANTRSFHEVRTAAQANYALDPKVELLASLALPAWDRWMKGEKKDPQALVNAITVEIRGIVREIERAERTALFSDGGPSDSETVAAALATDRQALESEVIGRFELDELANWARRGVKVGTMEEKLLAMLLEDPGKSYADAAEQLGRAVGTVKGMKDRIQKKNRARRQQESEGSPTRK